MTMILVTNQLFAVTWWNTSWNYRKSHIINGSAGAGTLYQIRIVAHKTTGSDNGTDVYLGNNVNNDFGDVRFTAGDGTTVLDYWLETGSLVSGTQAAFWVEVSADLGSNQTIYLYYGNGSATTTSNGVNTFILFDDFTGSSLDGSKWTKYNGGTPSFGSGLMTVSANSADPGKIVATGGGLTANNNAIVARVERTGGTHDDERFGVGVRTTNGSPAQGYNYALRTLTGTNQTWFLDDGVAWYGGTYGTWSLSTYYILEVCHDGTNVRGRTNYTTWNTQGLAGRTGTTYLALNIGSWDAITVWDWAFIRKCIAIEPTHSTWGTAQNVLLIGTSQTNAGCYGKADGTATVTFTSGNPPYTFVWSNSQTSNPATSLLAGNYSVTVTDNILLTATASVTITQPAAVITVSATVINVACKGESNGSINVTAANGSPPYFFSINNGVDNYPYTGSNPMTISGLPAGSNYKMRVKDNNGCTSPIIP